MTSSMAPPISSEPRMPALIEADRKTQRLRSIDPYLIDATLRENSVGSKIGLTLENKLAIFQKIRGFGFQRILLGSLNYALPEELAVEDDFMMALRDQGQDRSGCFALIDPGRVGPLKQFEPSLSQRRWLEYEVPNAIVEVCLADSSLPGAFDWSEFKQSLEGSVEWLRQASKGCEIIVNIVDGCDAFAENFERASHALRLCAELPIAGVSVEDDRGTFLPFQVGAYFAHARSLLPERVRLLAHIHAGAGYENASMMEALCQGADGAWGGLPKRTAINGHASLGELLANLERLGNPAARSYDLGRLLPLCAELALLIDGEEPPADLPILGANAYRLTLGFFRQREGRPHDLPPERVGGAYQYRVCPVVSDPETLIGRLCEVTGDPPEAFSQTLALGMIRLMRRDLRAGIRARYDDPQALLELCRRAKELPPLDPSL